MPYFFVAGGFILFTVAAAVVTLVTWRFQPLHALFPFTWRAWLWGSVGFAVANAILIGAVVLVLGAGDATSSHSRLVGVGSAFALIAGPFVASGLGTVMGVLLGCFFAWRSRTYVQ
jgi:hypothetical protein